MIIWEIVICLSITDLARIRALLWKYTHISLTLISHAKFTDLYVVYLIDDYICLLRIGYLDLPIELSNAHYQLSKATRLSSNEIGPHEGFDHNSALLMDPLTYETYHIVDCSLLLITTKLLVWGVATLYWQKLQLLCRFECTKLGGIHGCMSPYATSFSTPFRKFLEFS